MDPELLQGEEGNLPVAEDEPGHELGERPGHILYPERERESERESECSTTITITERRETLRRRLTVRRCTLYGGAHCTARSP